MHATDGAVRSAALFGEELPLYICSGVLRQGRSRVSALLRTVVHQTVLADVEVTSTRAATPVIRHTVGNLLLKSVEARVRAARQVSHLLPDAALFAAKRAKLTGAIVNDADG